MRRFYLPPGAIDGKRMVFVGDDARYICKVLRLKRGEGIAAFDGQGNEYIGTIGILSSRRVEAVITGVSRSTQTRRYKIALAQSLLKGSALDLVLRQCTEAGISDFYPLVSRRSVDKGLRWTTGRKKRWERIAVDAVRQSGWSTVPVVHDLHDWNGLLRLAPEFNLRLLPWEKEKGRKLKAALTGVYPPVQILVAIGPEGGFSDSEVEEAERAGFLSVNLGPAIYRASTAGLVTIASIHYHFQSPE